MGSQEQEDTMRKLNQCCYITASEVTHPQQSYNKNYTESTQKTALVTDTEDFLVLVETDNGESEH